jgi:hypothetical protein
MATGRLFPLNMPMLRKFPDSAPDEVVAWLP